MKIEVKKGEKGRDIYEITVENENDRRKLEKLVKQNSIDVRHSFADIGIVEIEELFKFCQKMIIGEHKYFELTKKPISEQIDNIRDKLNSSEHPIKEYHFFLCAERGIEVFCDAHDQAHW